MTQGFYVATNKCYGCKTCSIACAGEHQLTPGVLIRRVREFETSNPLGRAFVSMSCNHCDDPVCVANCPVGAYTKEEDTGFVIQDHDLCIGCKTCIDVCPFDAPSYDESDSSTYKCDSCIARRTEGLSPMCTITCPSMNIALDDVEQLSGTHTSASSIKDIVEVGPNLLVDLDPDITLDVFADIDVLPIDRGGVNY